MARISGGSVVAVFHTSVDAERALEQLRSNGVAAEDISVVMRNPDREGVGRDVGSNVLAAGGIGALFGALLGGAASWFMALGGMALPGTSPSSGIGSIAATAAGAVVGALIGGIVGGLTGLGIPASHVAEQVEEARIVVTVHTPEDAEPERVAELLEASGGQEVQSTMKPQDNQAVPSIAVASSLPAGEPSSTADTGAQGPAEDEVTLDTAIADEPAYTPSTWLAAEVPQDAEPGDPGNVTDKTRDVLLDVEASTGESGWYESLPDPPAPATDANEPATYSGLTEDEETWADIAAMERQEETTLDENPEGTNPNTVTGTQGSINPDTGTFGTAGTPLTTGHGVSGSTVGTGTTGGEQATQSGEFRGSTPDSANYERGGRGSSDVQQSSEPDEPDVTVEDKYTRRDVDAAPVTQDPGTLDVYESGPSYGPGMRQDVDRTDLYAESDVEAPPTYAVTPTDSAQASSGTDIPGTADPRGLGDNTDDVR